MPHSYKTGDGGNHLADLCQELLGERRLILVSNRGPVEYRTTPGGGLLLDRSTGGVVTALRSISKHIELTWFASTMGEGDRLAAAGHHGRFQVALPGEKLYVRFITSPRNMYHKYYNLFCNPLLWFLQHYMWNSPYTPNVDAKVYDAWENGYVAVNRSFADAIIEEAYNDRIPPFIMIHDYQLYLVGGYIRQKMPNAILQHFIHIPWPASSYWQLFPDPMRRAILESLCSLDIVGLQTSRDVHHFLHSCEIFLDEAKADYEKNTVLYGGREIKIASYPVSVDVSALRRVARSPRVQDYEEKLRPYLGEQTIVRVDRAEPSKNIARGLKSFDMLMERYPHLVNKVKFICFVVPSRSGIKQYERYTQEIFDAVNDINAKYGNGESPPVKLFFENNYAQSLAGMKLYDVLLVNPVIDGMNLVAKEGPIVNTRNGVLVLSESAGAYEQLKDYSLSVAPADLEGTTQALYDALTMSTAEREKKANSLRRAIEADDLTMWLCHQFRDLRNLSCQLPLLLEV